MGHFYLNQLILHSIKDNGRIGVTASGVHDPDSPGGAQGVPATLGDLAGLEKAAAGDGKFDMVDGGTFNADKAYKDSKLCNVLFTRELQRRLDEKGSSIKVNCFNPGLIVGRYHDEYFVHMKCFLLKRCLFINLFKAPVCFVIRTKYLQRCLMLQRRTY